MNLFSLLQFILNHPLNKESRWNALLRFTKWQLQTRFNRNPVIHPFTERSKLIVQRGLTGATQNIYCGLHDYEDMLFLLHFLRPEDTFIDVGANIGSYTVLAAAHVGAKVISFEPIPSTFIKLKDNIRLNNIDSLVTAHNLGVGATIGEIAFTVSRDTQNHVATYGENDSVKIPIDTLDAILIHQHPSLIKIDVEGYKTEVLKGSKNVLKSPTLKAIIIELNGSGSRYGFDEKQIHDNLLETGFRPYIYNPALRSLTRLEKHGNHNTIYLRDIDEVTKRITNGEIITILNQSF